jgi:hypothetical protein
MSEATAVADIAAFKAEYRHRQLSQFAPDTLLWLAALSEWTDQLAAAARFPKGDKFKSLTELLSRLSDSGLLATREDIDSNGEVLTAFWLPASRRPEVGEHLRGIWKNSNEIIKRLRDLANILEQQPSQQTDALRPWLQLVKHSFGPSTTNRGTTDGDPTGTKLLEEVDRLLAESRATEALSMVGAAQAVGDVLGDPFTSSARRAQWRIDRSYRQALDARSLRYYQPRPEVERSIDELLRGADASWALHLLGDGGVGKTMTIRDLCSGQFFSRLGNEQLPVARVDFDHLDPRYPQARPGELLLALAGELATYATTREIERRFRRSGDTIAKLHNVIASSGAVHRERQYFTEAIDAFASYLRGFARPVVLVLDTCEELAKLHPPGGRAPAVDRTFELLEQIHERVPQMRALLAGRRWLVPPPAGASTGGLELDPRHYLRVVPIGGFTYEQARQYIDRRDTEKRLPSEVRVALVARSTRPSGIGVNPFDLVSYCEWALAEPNLDVEVLRNARGDPYVERRIIDRLSTREVRDCLPVAVELGRFDRAMIEPELRRRGIDLDKAFSGLVSQEWVSAVAFDADGRPRVIEVDAHLRPRLHAIIAARPMQFPIDRIRVGRDLAHLVNSSPLEELAVDAVEAALRLLPMADAATMWDRLEERIANTPGSWQWAGQAIVRAAAVEAQRTSDDGVTMLAAIRATQAASVLRQPGRPGIHALWEEVERLASRHPDPGTGRRLQFRALCFLVEPGDTGRLQRLVSIWREYQGELPVGSILAKLDEITGGGAPVPTELVTVLDELCQFADPGVAAIAQLVRAASRREVGDLDNATADIDSALRLIDAMPLVPSQWADWIEVARFRDRLRLARLVLAMQRSEHPEMFPIQIWRADALKHTDDIDSERLVAVIITLELCWRLVDPRTVASAAAADTYNPARQPTHIWHNATPTLCAAIATAVAARGDLRRAARLLHDRSEAALSYEDDSTTIKGCEEFLAKLSRAFRTTKLTTSIHRIARNGSSMAREHAWAALALTDGESPSSPADAGNSSIWWRTQIVKPGEQFVAIPPEGLAETDTEVLEDTLIRGRQLPSNARHSADIARLSVERCLMVIRGESANLATALRTEALLNRLRSWSHVLGNLPPRLVAETALAEAELVALRLPKVSLRLLHAAFNCANAADDPILVGRAAVLLVLATARAGNDMHSISMQHQYAIQEFLTGKWDLSGWYDRCEKAKTLLGATSVATTYSPKVIGSPELDPRPIHGEPPVAPASPAVSIPEWMLSNLEGEGEASPGPSGYVSALGRLGIDWPSNRAAGEGEAPPELSELSEYLSALDRPGIDWPSSIDWPSNPAAGEGEASLGPSEYWSSPGRPGSVFHGTYAETVMASDSNLPTRGGSSRGLSTAIIISRLLIDPGHSIARRWRGYWLRRRYDHRTIALDPKLGVDSPLPCRLMATAVEVRIEHATSPSTLPRFRRKYMVIPLLGRGNVKESTEQYLTDQLSSLIGKRRPLFVRFHANNIPLSLQFWGGRSIRHDKIRAEYQGPPSLHPPDNRKRTEPAARWCTVLHLVGTPVDTPSGWRLRIAVSSSSSSESYVKSGRWTYRGEELINPHDIYSGQVALVVLQAEPVDELPQPLGEQYEGMSALAAELLEARAGAVLIVPPLPEAVAFDVVLRVRDAMTRHGYRIHPGHVLDLADEVRNIVASSEEPTRAEARASQDVMLLA